MMLNTDYHYDSLDVRTNSGTKTGEMVDAYIFIVLTIRDTDSIITIVFYA